MSIVPAISGTVAMAAAADISIIPERLASAMSDIPLTLTKLVFPLYFLQGKQIHHDDGGNRLKCNISRTNEKQIGRGNETILPSIDQADQANMSAT